MELEHVILAGDSAGAHLAVSVSMLALVRGFRKPNGILIHYPVFSVGTKFYPSHSLALDEELLSQTFLFFVMACFMKNGGNPDHSPIASPIIAPKALLNALPNMIIFGAETDVLRDQGIHFLHRVLEADEYKTKDRAKMYYMKEHMHGWCNLNTKVVGVDEYKNGTELTAACFRRMFMSF